MGGGRVGRLNKGRGRGGGFGLNRGFMLKARANDFKIHSILLHDVDCWGGQTVSTHHQHLIEQGFTRGLLFSSGCYYRYGHNTSWRDRLVRTLISNNVERGGQMASNSFNIRENKRLEM